MKKPSLGKLSLSSKGARYHFAVGIMLTSVIPALIIASFLMNEPWRKNLGLPAFILVGACTALLVILGYAILRRYPAAIARLQTCLENVTRGDMPDTVKLEHAGTDIGSIEISLNRILSELKGRIRSINEEKDHLETALCQGQKLKVMGTMAAGIVHEISTPVQFVGDNMLFISKASQDILKLGDMYMGVLNSSQAGGELSGKTDEVEAMQKKLDLPFLRKEMSEAIQQSREGLEQVALIVRAMHDFVYMGTESGKTPTDINETIDHAVTLARNKWKYVAEMKLALDQELPLISCHRGDITQILVNLIANAADAISDANKDDSQQTGTITVKSCRENNCIQVRITDTGTGIPEEVKPKVFEQFFTTKVAGRGSGQGLAITRSLITKKHKGTIEFDTEIGKGTTFTVSIPIEPGQQG